MPAPGRARQHSRYQTQARRRPQQRPHHTYDTQSLTAQPPLRARSPGPAAGASRHAAQNVVWRRNSARALRLTAPQTHALPATGRRRRRPPPGLLLWTSQRSGKPGSCASSLRTWTWQQATKAKVSSPRPRAGRRARHGRSRLARQAPPAAESGSVYSCPVAGQDAYKAPGTMKTPPHSPPAAQGTPNRFVGTHHLPAGRLLFARLRHPRGATLPQWTDTVPLGPGRLSAGTLPKQTSHFRLATRCCPARQPGRRAEHRQGPRALPVRRDTQTERRAVTSRAPLLAGAPRALQSCQPPGALLRAGALAQA